MRRCHAILLALVAIPAPGAAQPADDLQNWFDDPFFQISADLADCPRPAGPFTTERERRLQAHRRAEKGTTCWLARACERPNAYAYDQDIASALQAAVREHPPFGPSTLWVTVQGRVVYIEGCATDDSVAVRAAAVARGVPNVQQAIAAIRVGTRARAPYRLRDAASPAPPRDAAPRQKENAR